MVIKTTNLQITDSLLIYGFATLKLLIHFLTNTRYGLHRDEYLYYETGQHLDFGFMEISPLISVIAKTAGWLGGSTFAIRLFPALIGSVVIVLAGHLTKEMNGKRWAVIFTCIFLVFSPAQLASNTLFQPVSFNQFFWLLLAFLTLKAVRSEQTSYWWWLGMALGLGFLTKYSILFYATALVVALIITGESKIFKGKKPYLALGVTLLIALPNVIWQHLHHWPVVSHFQALNETQLVHVDWKHFLSSQLRFHCTMSLIWMVGLAGLFMVETLRPYRFLAVAFLLTLLLIGLLHGKAYYTIGAFLPLFSAGGVALESLIRSYSWRAGLIAASIVLSLPVLPYSLPLLEVSTLKIYHDRMPDYPCVKQKMRWEDNKYYQLPQDIADMHGWEELAKKVSAVYYSLPQESRDKCLIYGGSYAHASVVNYYRNKYQLPVAYSFNGSHLFWANPQLEIKVMILIDDRTHQNSQWFNRIELADSITNPHAREPGYIYLGQDPKVDLSQAWYDLLQEQQAVYGW